MQNKKKMNQESHKKTTNLVSQEMFRQTPVVARSTDSSGIIPDNEFTRSPIIPVNTLI